MGAALAVWIRDGMLPNVLVLIYPIRRDRSVAGGTPTTEATGAGDAR